MHKLAKYSLAGAVVIGIAATASYRHIILGSLPDLDGEITVKSYHLQSAVAVTRDALGQPVITANTQNQAGFALGYVHGQDRFFQLDLSRRFAAGELSALFGEKAIEKDKEHRIHRFRAVAKQAVTLLNKHDKALLDAYVAGVNEGLSQLDSKPIEYWLLGQTPRAWTAEDSMLVSISMFINMTNGVASGDFGRDLLMKAGGQPLLDMVQPIGSRWDSAIDGTKMPGAQLPDKDDFVLASVTSPNNPSEVVSEVPMVGSNSWAVSGEYTRHGAALLSNDPHLGLSVPHIWYRAQLNYKVNGEPVSMTGASLPGLPGIAIGSNGHMAWGMTNSAGDWSDYIELEVDGKQYQTNAGLVPFEIYPEVIEVANQESIKLDVHQSKWGPLVTLADGRKAAYRWLPHYPDAINAFPILDIGVSKTVAQSLAVAKKTGVSPFNFLVADEQGDIGWTIAGYMPRRNKNSEVVLHWSDVSDDWSDWLKPHEYPQAVTADTGRIWTANNRIIGGEDLSKIGLHSYELGARSWLIEQDLKAHDSFDITTMTSMLKNNKAVVVEAWRNDLIAILERREHVSEVQSIALNALINWSGRASVNDVGYTIAREYRRQFIKSFSGSLNEYMRQSGVLPEDHKDVKITNRQIESTIRLLVDGKPQGWLPKNYPTYDAWSWAILDLTLSDLEQRFGSIEEANWGRVNALKMRHPMASALPDWLAAKFNMPENEQAGDSNMPLVAGPTAGQSLRFIVAPGRESEAVFAMPGGQSGHPWSPFYTAGHSDWVNHVATPLLPGSIEHSMMLVSSTANN